MNFKNIINSLIILSLILIFIPLQVVNADSFNTDSSLIEMTQIYEYGINSVYNYGALTSADVGDHNIGVGQKHRTLFRFPDLNDSMAAQGVVTWDYAVLSLWINYDGGLESGDSVRIRVHKTTRFTWVEGSGTGSNTGDVSWDFAVTGTNWTTAGGDYNATADDDTLSLLSGVGSGRTSITINGTTVADSNNVDIILIAEVYDAVGGDDGAYIRFATTDHGTVSRWPILTVYYTPDGGTTVSPVSTTADSLHSDYSSELDSIAIQMVTPSNVGYENAIIAWAISGFPDSSNSGDTLNHPYKEDSTFVDTLDGLNYTEPYTLYLSSWCWDDVLGWSVRTTASVIFDIRNVIHSLAETEITDSTFTITNTYSNDIGITRHSLYYSLSSNMANKDSVVQTSSFGSPDTLKVTGLLEGTIYYYYWAVTDDYGVDASHTSSYPNITTTAPISIGNWPTACLDTIVVSSIPVTLGLSDTCYTLSGNLTTTGNGLTIAGNNLNVSLGIDTLKYSDNYGDDGFGITLNGNNVKISGGVIIGGDPSNGPTNESWRNVGITYNNADTTLLLDVTSIVYGWNSHCAEGTGFNSMNEIDGGEYTSWVEGYTSRCAYDGTALILQGVRPGILYPMYAWKVHDILIANTPHAGIRALGVYELYNNDIWLSARNDLYTPPNTSGNACETFAQTYGFILRQDQTYYDGAGSSAYNNVIRVKDDYFGGEGGFLIEYSGGTEELPINIYNNACTTSYGLDPQYGYIAAHFIKIRFQSTHVNIYDNTFLSICDSDAGTSHIGEVVGTIRIQSKYEEGVAPDSFINIHNNNGFAQALDSGISFCSVVEWAVTDPLDINYVDWDSAGNSMHDNYFKSSHIIHRIGMGEGNAHRLTVRGDTVINDIVAGLDFRTFNVGHYSRPCSAITVLDYIYLGATSYDDIQWNAATSVPTYVTVARTFVATLFANGVEVLGDTILVTNGIPTDIIDTFTNANGEVSGQIPYHRAIYNASNVDYNDIRFRVISDGTPGTVLLDSTFTITDVNTVQSVVSGTDSLEIVFGGYFSADDPDPPTVPVSTHYRKWKVRW